MKQSWLEVVELKDNIQKKVHHSFLNYKLEDLHIDQYQVGIFQLLLDQLDVSKEKIEPYITALTLVKTALDLHESVNKERLNKTQMIILAGDLYSGYYYQLLSYIQEVGLVREIATGIKETNMKKIHVLKNYENKNELPFHLFKEIELAIIEHVCKYFGKIEHVEQSAQLLYLNRLICEYRHDFSKSTVYQSCFIEDQSTRYYEMLRNEIINQISMCSRENNGESYYNILRMKIIERWNQCM